MSKSTKHLNEKYGLNVKDLMLFNKTTIDKFNTFQFMGKPTTRGKDIAKRFFLNPWSIFGLIILFSIILLTIIGPLASPYNGVEPIDNSVITYVSKLNSSYSGPQTIIRDKDFVDNIINIEERSGLKIIYENTFLAETNRYKINYDPYTLLQGLSGSSKRLASIIGTDSYGRDVWTRVLIGTRNALFLSLLILTIQTIIGVVLGSYLGFHIGKRIDTLIMRVIEIFNAIPAVLWIVILIGIFGTSFWSVFITLTIINIFGPISTTRMFMISIKDSEFLLASKAVGSSKLKVIYIEALPLIIGKLASNFVSNLMTGVFALSSLAFLGFVNDGLGTSPNLGLSLFSSRLLAATNPLAVAFPVLILLTAVSSLKIVAIRLHDALDVKATKGV